MTSAPSDEPDAAAAALADALEAIGRFAAIPAWQLAEARAAPRRSPGWTR